MGTTACFLKGFLPFHIPRRGRQHLEPVVGISQSKLPAGNHGLQGSPVISTDEAPAEGPRSPYLHLDSPFMSAAAPTESDL